MPFTVHDEAEGLWVTLTGFAVPYEFQEVALATAAHPDRDRHRYHLFDFSDIDRDALFALTEAIGASHAAKSREIFGDRENPKFTGLISPHEKMQTVFRVFIDSNPRPPGHVIRRFTTLKQARAWLRECLNGEHPENAG
ncbi:MAG TPA: hypothetical protein DIW51_05065 [Rhodospirillaceae bacterium]|jgi:hypothetical protein|nr:hypothetical protein [Magnetovibrio sp.]HBT43429.1 hypothetical protein [Rhodospirillaceae bacterium]HCS69322.1 hypothetical protein [Rhodospirillaceae bacterium]|tara:strand:+ start:842 stop:1258 length:417 start_codon:yes stop_codon:yes gene_type:complete